MECTFVHLLHMQVAAGTMRTDSSKAKSVPRSFATAVLLARKLTKLKQDALGREQSHPREGGAAASLGGLRTESVSGKSGQPNHRTGSDGMCVHMR